MFKHAIVRTPSQSLIDGLTSVDLGKPDYQKALQQHQRYISALQACGLTVTCLPALEQFPDSTFVEDVALLTPNCAVITNPGAVTRQGETQFITAAIEKFYPTLERIESPGTVEAGDVMMVGSHFYIGLSERTNAEGAAQLIKILEKHSHTGSVVSLTEVLHLKTGLGYLEDSNLLACGEFLTKPEFSKFCRVEVDANEAYAANSVWINGTVLTPKGFPKTKQKIVDLGYNVIEVDVSEFQKVDGGLSCLSLRF